jgi:hypothetical protein
MVKPCHHPSKVLLYAIVLLHVVVSIVESFYLGAGHRHYIPVHTSYSQRHVSSQAYQLYAIETEGASSPCRIKVIGVG